MHVDRQPHPDKDHITHLLCLMHLAWSMMKHDRMKMFGGIMGVLFATVLTAQQGGTLLGLAAKNTMLVDRLSADIWIVPKDLKQLQGGDGPIPDYVLYRAQSMEGVLWATPLLFGAAAVSLPEGGAKPITLLGIDASTLYLQPWNVVAGQISSLRQPKAMFFEHSMRSKLGGLNMGDMREVNGKQSQVVGFTWGLEPFGPSYAFAAIDHARQLLNQPSNAQSMVLVKVEHRSQIQQVKARLQASLTNYAVHTQAELSAIILKYLLTETAIGITFGTATLFGLIVGFVIVAISMFSAVLDNIREFGTLKAIGASNLDLTLLMVFQSCMYGALGSLIGLVLVGFMAKGMRSPNLALVLPEALIFSLPPLMILLCMGASWLALNRLRKLEPGIVFR